MLLKNTFHKVVREFTSYEHKYLIPARRANFKYFLFYHFLAIFVALLKVFVKLDEHKKLNNKRTQIENAAQIDKRVTPVQTHTEVVEYEVSTRLNVKKIPVHKDAVEHGNQRGQAK